MFSGERLLLKIQFFVQELSYFVLCKSTTIGVAPENEDLIKMFADSFRKIRPGLVTCKKD